MSCTPPPYLYPHVYSTCDKKSPVMHPLYCTPHTAPPYCTPLYLYPHVYGISGKMSHCPAPPILHPPIFVSPCMRNRQHMLGFYMLIVNMQIMVRSATVGALTISVLGMSLLTVLSAVTVKTNPCRMEPKKATMSALIPRRVVMRVCIWYGVKLGLSVVDTYTKMRQTFGRTCYSRITVFRWYLDFRAGREKLGDLMRQGAPIRARSRRNIRWTKVAVVQNRRITIDQLSSSIGISHGTIHKILHENLGMSKKSAKMIPHKLTPGQQNTRLQFCQQFLHRYQTEPRFLRSILTTDEAWFYVVTPGRRWNPESG